MRIVRETGNVSLLLPEGIDHIVDLPYTISNAIIAALRWIKIREQPLDEQPPKRIWLNSEAMEAWWKKVDRERREKYGIKPDDDDPGEEGVDYADNAFSLVSK